MRKIINFLRGWLVWKLNKYGCENESWKVPYWKKEKAYEWMNKCLKKEYLILINSHFTPNTKERIYSKLPTILLLILNHILSMFNNNSNNRNLVKIWNKNICSIRFPIPMIYLLFYTYLSIYLPTHPFFYSLLIIGFPISILISPLISSSSSHQLYIFHYYCLYFCIKEKHLICYLLI